MSVPSSKTIVTTDRPYLEIDRISVVRGVPAMARSTGMLTYFSTSTGDSAGAAVMTCTCTFVMSGTASMGSVNAARTPSARKTTDATRTMARFCRDNRTMAERTPMSLFLGDRALESDALQGEGTFDHHLFAFAEAVEDLHFAERAFS